MYTAEDILLQREKRIEYQEKLLQKYKMPLLVIRVNYPGVNKDNSVSQGIAKVMEKAICEKFSDSIHNKIITTTAEGPLVIIFINKDAKDIKLVAMDIEEKHPLGRCVDIDVYDESGLGISRGDFDLGMRKCYLCNDIAHNCVRSRKHNSSEVEEFIKNKFLEYMEISHGE